MRAIRVTSLLVMLALLALAGPTAHAADGKGSYIVVFKDSVDHPRIEAGKHNKKHEAKVKVVYTKAIKGYAAKVKHKDVAKLRADPTVAFVVADGVVTIAGKNKPPKGPKSTPPPEPSPDPAEPPSSCSTASNSWGLDRIDQRDLPLSKTYCSANAGAGVTAYIIDTGIDINHSEFGGRAAHLFDAIDGGTADDCNGHGTHVAGTVGGAKYGVAKGVDLLAVRVLNCNGYGTWSGVIAGIDAVVAHHKAGDPAVANMSLSGGANAAVDNAVAAAIADGISFAVAAANNNRNACNYSPARVGPALTVGATTSSDARASYSNYGSCVDLFAPGSSITSAWIGSGNTETRSISGTSMASPHVAGVAAQYLSDHNGAAPSAVAKAVVDASTSGRISGLSRKTYKGTPNKLLYTEPAP